MVRRRGAALAVAMGLIVGTGPGAAAQPPGVLNSPLKTGQRISLDLKGVDILDVLKLLSQKSGLNFIAGRNVSGRVTIFVHDVDVWEAFELIIGANDLAYERQGDIVTVMMARDYELLYGAKFLERRRSVVTPLKYAKAIQVATVLNQVKSAVGQVVTDEGSNTIILSDAPTRLEEMQTLLKQLDRPTESRVYHLNYTEAEKLKEKVQEILSPVGMFSFDQRTNTVVITDLKETLAKLDGVIRAFDMPDGEVLIEAKILKVELTDAMDLGIDWQQVFAKANVDTRTNFRVLGDIVGASSPVTGAALKWVTTSTDKTTLIIEALKKLTKTETLSNPRIMVSNNQEAKILVGTKEAVVTVTTTVPATGATVSAPEIQFVDVGTKLFVTPNVKRDGHIQMKIRPEVSTAKVETFQTNRIPIVTSTEAETSVLVKSGSTLIIGGLIETKNERTDNRVPILGDIPIIGRAFGGTTSSKKKTELVVFLTPQIILPDGTAFNPTPAEIGTPLPDRTRDAVPAAYRQTVRQRLQAYLLSALRGAKLPKGSVMLSFVLHRNGVLLGEPEISSPEGGEFIQAAMKALTNAQPFPPFPPESSAEEVRFKLTVDYAP